MEVITVMNIKLNLDLDLISEVYEELNIAYKILNDATFYNKGFNILKRGFNRNKERIPLFDSVYIALMRDLGIEKIATLMIILIILRALLKFVELIFLIIIIKLLSLFSIYLYF